MAEGLRFEHRMSDADALMWTIEKDPMLRSTIVAVAVLDQAPDHSLLTERFERASRLVPRLRQRVVSSPLSVAPPRWETDPNFDLRFHLRWLRAPAGGGLTDVLQLAEPIAMHGFDRARPLWEFYVVEGLADDQAAVILKLHHSITDGVGAVKIGMVLFDFERSPSTLGPMPDAPDVRVLSWPERIVDAVEHERRRQLGVARRMPATLAGAVRRVTGDPRGSARRLGEMASSIGRMLAPATTPASPIMTGRSLSVQFDSISLPLDETKAAAKAAGGRLNDAFVAGVLSGMRRYHERHGHPCPALRMTMPINVREGESEDLAGNAFAPARFMVPLDIDDPIERMARVRELVQQQRAEPSLALLDPMALVMHRLPTSVTTAVFASLLKGIDFVTSNVPGIPIPVFFAGSEVVSQFAFGPMSGSAANITLLSYRDELHIGVNTDPAAIPDRAAFIGCLRDGFDEIRKVA